MAYQWELSSLIRILNPDGILGMGSGIFIQYQIFHGVDGMRCAWMNPNLLILP
jgi:hypothetical protein